LFLILSIARNSLSMVILLVIQAKPI
jgi:hypothetical protein